MLVKFSGENWATTQYQFKSKWVQSDMNSHDIDVIFLGEFDNTEYNCYIQFQREGESKPSPKILMTPKIITYLAGKFKGYTYRVSTEWFTAIAGTLKATIEVKQFEKTGLETNKAFGIVNIPIEEALSDNPEVESTITNEEYLALINAINAKLNIDDEKVFFFEEEKFSLETNFAQACRDKKAELNVSKIYLGLILNEPTLGLVDGDDSVTILSSNGRLTKITREGIVDSVKIDKVKDVLFEGTIDATRSEFKVSTPNTNDTAEKAVNKQYADAILTSAQTYVNTKTAELNQAISVATTRENLSAVIGTSDDSKDGLMSKDMYTTIRNMNRLLNEGDKSYVDTFNEILKIFEQYPTGSNLLEILNSKIDTSTYERHEEEYQGFKKEVEETLENNSVKFVSDNYNTNITQVLQHNHDYSFKTNNITSVSLSIPASVSQGFISGFSIKIGGTVPTISFANGSSYPMLFTLNGMQRKARQLVFKPMQTLTGAVLCDGVNVYVYLKEMQQEVLLS